MWPFTRRSKAPLDPLTHEVDLSKLGPFHEAERYLLVWPNALSQSYGLAIVYEGRGGDRVHVVHSPGYDHGGAMETHGEWIGTAVRRRDPATVALFLAWPRDRSFIGEQESELIRVWFAPNPSGVASPRQTILMSEAADGAPQVDNVFTKPVECLYRDMSYGHPRQSPDYWAKVLGCPIPTFAEAEWVLAADQVDPGRVERAAVEKGTQDAFDGQMAWMKEMGVYGDEQSREDPLDEAAAELVQPPPAQRERLERCWSREPAAVTTLIGSCSIGGGNIGNSHHPAPVVSLFLPADSLAELPLDLSDFHGPEAPPPEGRRLRLWDETLLTIEETGRWRFVVYMDQDLLPPWWFGAASAPPSERPHGVVALSFRSDSVQVDDGPTDLLSLGDAVGLAHLEDCRALQ